MYSAYVFDCQMKLIRSHELINVHSENTDSVKQSRVKLEFFLDPKQDTDEVSLWLVELWMAEGQVGGRGRG